MDEVTDPVTQISLVQAKVKDPRNEIGDVVNGSDTEEFWTYRCSKGKASSCSKNP